MSVLVIKQGLLDTIQDEGRYGFQHLGVNPGGVMDAVSAQIANMLVGNERSEAVIELHFPAASFLFRENCLIAIAGADFCASINDEDVPLDSLLCVDKNSVLKFKRHVRRSRCYLAACGGWNADRWLNSSSTNLKISKGGFSGRALKKDDIIGIKESKYKSGRYASKILPVHADTSCLYDGTKKIRCVTGNEYDWLDNDAKQTFWSSAFAITPDSDRMGYRLQGKMLTTKEEFQMLSSAVTQGTVQLLPSGQLVVLMADHQTTGGYPGIAHVISADLHKLAQLHAHENLEFELVTQAEAEQACMQQQEYLKKIEDKIRLQLTEYFNNDPDRS